MLVIKAATFIAAAALASGCGATAPSGADRAESQAGSFGKDGGCGLSTTTALILDDEVLQDGVHLSDKTGVLPEDRRTVVRATATSDKVSMRDIEVTINGPSKGDLRAGQKRAGESGRSQEIDVTLRRRDGAGARAREELLVRVTLESEVPGCEGETAARIISQPITTR